MRAGRRSQPRARRRRTGRRLRLAPHRGPHRSALELADASRGRPWRTHLADLNYHCYHVHLLTQLAEPFPDAGLAEVAARWQGYVDSAGLTCPAR